MKKLILCLLALAAISVLPQQASAIGMYPGACGTMCMANGGGMFQPFYGQPYFPQMPNNYYAMQTGQMNYYGPATQYPQMDMTPLYVSNNLNWMGVQPMGMTMGTPIGLPNLGANLMWRGMMAQ